MEARHVALRSLQAAGLGPVAAGAGGDGGDSQWAPHRQCSVAAPKTSISRQRRSVKAKQTRADQSTNSARSHPLGPFLAQLSATSAPPTAAAAPLAGFPEFRLSQ
ncbi:hypothetical protein JDV02_008987 [Purpureocillium takamizusanense]|uniref:Uncharacterized protein n=1 Tax=Purpureocillium takamizusanense TaxID=2060973 RepID=A0A9Q8QRH4_9HYPO|nr:uncharacterized protein JDV02_008987 [Purpureocillium takamizusanense]UNI23152.1 hypothetical protein JDV02_008987 [Purpureocillium takamizusanense]